MAFAGIEFSERGGGGVALICSEWLTPRKRHCFWPPIKSSFQFEKALIKRIPTNEQDWAQYEVSRCFFETDDFPKEKQKKTEFTSKVASDEDLNEVDYPIKRKISVVRRFYDSDDEDEGCKKTILQRPPQIKLMVNIEFAAVQSISLLKNCSSSISSPSTSSFIINEYDSDDILSKGMSDENSCNLEFNNNVIDCDKSKISTLSNVVEASVVPKEQNTLILKEHKILNSKPNTQRHQSFEPPLDILVGLPLRTVEDVLSLEKYLSNGDNLSALVSYLSTLGGRDLTNKTNIILRCLLTNEVAQLYSYRGTRLGKRALSTLNLKTVVVRAVQTGCSATENDVCSNIKVWLNHARGQN
ncbi:hypothetical protein FQA39_LY10654 [Lamprigera yunnana]|nr:hypothetical protein FQA39_LY10654 [Lamprigera yunnana]